MKNKQVKEITLKITGHDEKEVWCAEILHEV